MKLNTKLLCPTLVLGLALVGCKPIPYEQDGSELWMAGARPYEEVLASVESHIDPSLQKSITFMTATASATLPEAPLPESATASMPSREPKCSEKTPHLLTCAASLFTTTAS